MHRPRTRKEIDVALHGIGLAIEALLDEVCVPEPAAVTRELSGGEALPDLHVRLNELLIDAAIDARRIEIVVEGQCVTLRGTVRDELARLLAEDLAWSLSEVSDCDNRLAVADAP